MDLEKKIKIILLINSKRFKEIVYKTHIFPEGNEIPSSTILFVVCCSDQNFEEKEVRNYLSTPKKLNI